jgi:hypothetical protein
MRSISPQKKKKKNMVYFQMDKCSQISYKYLRNRTLSQRVFKDNDEIESVIIMVLVIG